MSFKSSIIKLLKKAAKKKKKIMEEEEEIKTNTFWSKSVPSDFAIPSECLQL